MVTSPTKEARKVEPEVTLYKTEEYNKKGVSGMKWKRSGHEHVRSLHEQRTNIVTVSEIVASLGIQFKAFKRNI